jgi:hypothetical protein
MHENLLSPLRNAPHTTPDWEAMEERLVTSLTARTDRSHRLPAARAGWAAAAVVVVASALTFYPLTPPTSSPVPSGAAAHDRRLPTPPSDVSHQSPPAAPATGRSHKTTTSPGARRAPTGDAQRAPLDNFMLLPGAAGLPEFESGRVVRMAVPITNLPAYGFDVVPDASPGTIDADFLVGQDGIPRAIRLATYERN